MLAGADGGAGGPTGNDFVTTFFPSVGNSSKNTTRKHVSSIGSIAARNVHQQAAIRQKMATTKNGGFGAQKINAIYSEMAHRQFVGKAGPIPQHSINQQRMLKNNN